MTDRQPESSMNLDRYGHETLPWSRVLDALRPAATKPETPFFLSTCRPDGRPHTAGIGIVVHGGDLYFTSGLEKRKARNLAGNPACTISTRLPGIDVVFEGDATLVTDQETIVTLASLFREGGWPAEAVDGAISAPFSAPSAGPPPWHLFRFRYHTVIGVGTDEPSGATRWRFVDKGASPGSN